MGPMGIPFDSQASKCVRGKWARTERMFRESDVCTCKKAKFKVYIVGRILPCPDEVTFWPLSKTVSLFLFFWSHYQCMSMVWVSRIAGQFVLICQLSVKLFFSKSWALAGSRPKPIIWYHQKRKHGRNDGFYTKINGREQICDNF